MAKKYGRCNCDTCVPKHAKVGLKHVYVIGGESGPVKIGIATDPGKRLAALRTAVPYEIFIHHSIQNECAHIIEKATHKELSSLRANGEWFTCAPDVALAIIKKHARIAAESHVVVSGNKSRLRYGAARVSFERNKEKIMDGIKEKKTLTMIYDSLEDQLCMPLRTFRWHVQRMQKSLG